MNAVKNNKPEGCLEPALIFIIWVALAVLLFGCAVEKSRTFNVTGIKENEMVLNGKYKVQKCDTCKVGDKITAFRIY